MNNNVTLRTDYINGMEVTPSTLTTVVQMVRLSHTNWPENQYRFQGKELNTTGFDTNGDNVIDSRLYQYDFSARQYDPLIGKWHSADPANQYSSPYVAMSNNWITRIAPDGRFADRIKGHQVYGITAYYYWIFLNSRPYKP